MQALEEILDQAKSAIQSATDMQTLNDCRVKYLGKKGQITQILKSLGSVDPAERPAMGQKINQAKVAIQSLIEARADQFKLSEVEDRLAKEAVDVTLPGRQQSVGSIHPVVKTFRSLRRIFGQMGFVFLDGPEIEDDFHNFEALNIPPLHPARAMQDTFYFEDGMLLRTHMSPVQIRAMQERELPLRMVAMGRVYRRDFDLTHTPMFHQMECLIVDEDVTFADLKGILQQFISAFFCKDVPLRFRPSYFPFTEPSAEVDIQCVTCDGKGCRICKDSGWLEVLGAGLVHPNVFKASGVDSKKYQGLAFGLGIDRLTMLKYGVTDLRALFENDLRFLGQF